MRAKIKNHFKKNYNSSPIEVSKQEIDFIIERDCECDSCGTSIFELDDYPHIDIEECELMCEDCYCEEYYEYCPVCEESNHEDCFTDYFFISKSISKEVEKLPGLYKIAKRPFYCANCVTGFEYFFDDAIEKVSDIEIESVCNMLYQINDSEIKLDCICNKCFEKFTRNKNFLKATGNTEIIFFDKYRDKYFAEYSDEQIRRSRQQLVHKRINFRGILEKFNCTKK